MDHIPDEDEIEEIVLGHLDDFDADEATAAIEILPGPPEWLSISEKDQMNAHLRDGGVCVLVVYMQEGEGDFVDDFVEDDED